MYIVEKDYPGSPFAIGDTLYEDGNDYTNQGPICIGVPYTEDWQVVGWNSNIDPKKKISKEEIVKYTEIFKEFKL